MKRVIFTYYEQMDVYYKHERNNQLNVEEYLDRLIKNKKDYADSIEVDFIYYDKVNPSIRKLATNTFNSDEDNFVNVNLFKHILMANLAEKYDEIMYVDMDVVFNTKKNIFKEIDLSKGIAVKDSNEDIVTKDLTESVIFEIAKKNPTCKFFITQQMLGHSDCNVINTGIMIGKSEHIKKIKFLERLPRCVELIETIRNTHNETDFFYPNNEAIFSYLLEKFNIPYQLLSDKWHDIRNHKDNGNPLGYVIHIINKNFDIFFNDKKKVIFSIYIDIPEKKLDAPGPYAEDIISKSKRTKIELKKYSKQLIENKKEYATLCKANFKLFEKDNQYKTFSDQFPDLSQYDIVNLYKIYLMYELSKEYDHILYLDFDVMYHKPVSIFHVKDFERYLNVNWEIIRDVNFINTNIATFDFRSPFIKYWNSRALLEEDDEYCEIRDVAFNTGIVATSKSILQKLDYWSDIHTTIAKMKDLREDPNNIHMYPRSMKDAFGYDNEAIFGYKVFKNNIDYKDLSGTKWHYKVEGAPNKKYSKDELLEKDPVLIHFINKKMGWYLKEIKGHDIEVDY